MEKLTYKQLCEKLDLPVLGGNAKKKQLEDLQGQYKIVKLSNPTRYIIEEEYDEVRPLIDKINGNDKFQMIFDAALYQLFLDNYGRPIYASRMDLLKLFKEVNKNFGNICNEEYVAKLGAEFSFMSEMGQVVYKILTQWTIRRLEQMRKRKILTLADGFRLIKEMENGYRFAVNVPYGSKLHQECQAVYSQLMDGMPNWMPLEDWKKFKRVLSQVTQQHFNGEYQSMKPVYILTPPTEEWLQRKLDKLYAEINIPVFEEINKEAARKILATKQLNKFSIEERNKFVDMNVKHHPGLDISPANINTLF